MTPEIIDRALDCVIDADNHWRADFQNKQRYAVLKAARAYLEALLTLAVSERVITEARAEQIRVIA